MFGSLALGSHSQAGNILLRDACCDTFGFCFRWWFLATQNDGEPLVAFICGKPVCHFWLLFTLLADCLVFTLLAAALGGGNQVFATQNGHEPVVAFICSELAMSLSLFEVVVFAVHNDHHHDFRLVHGMNTQRGGICLWQTCLDTFYTNYSFKLKLQF